MALDDPDFYLPYISGFPVIASHILFKVLPSSSPASIRLCLELDQIYVSQKHFTLGLLKSSFVSQAQEIIVLHLSD